jgi:hypothetical protein
MIVNNDKYGFRDFNEFKSYGFGLDKVSKASDDQKALPTKGIIKAKIGTLALDTQDNQTVYLIGPNNIIQSFSSKESFLALGYKFTNLIKLNLSDYSKGSIITTNQTTHPEGSLILDKSQIYLILNNQRLPFPSETTFKSYGFSFNQFVPSNAFDKAIPVGEVVRE